MTDRSDADKIRIVSIVGEEPRNDGEGPYDWAKVIFQIDNGLKYPIFVGRTAFNDEDIIRVARHYLHMQAQRLADSTASWKMSQDEIDKLANPPQQKFPDMAVK